MGLKIGLAKPIWALKMGLEVILAGLDMLIPEIGYEPVIVGEDATELTVEQGIDIGTDMGSRGVPDTARALMMGETKDG